MEEAVEGSISLVLNLENQQGKSPRDGDADVNGDGDDDDVLGNGYLLMTV